MNPITREWILACLILCMITNLLVVLLIRRIDKMKKACKESAEFLEKYSSDIQKVEKAYEILEECHYSNNFNLEQYKEAVEPAIEYLEDVLEK